MSKKALEPKTQNFSYNIVALKDEGLKCYVAVCTKLYH